MIDWKRIETTRTTNRFSKTRHLKALLKRFEKAKPFVETPLFLFSTLIPTVRHDSVEARTRQRSLIWSRCYRGVVWSRTQWWIAMDESSDVATTAGEAREWTRGATLFDCGWVETTEWWSSRWSKGRNAEMRLERDRDD